MKVCEMGDSLCMEVGKRRKKAMKTPRRRNLRLRIGWDLGLIFSFLNFWLLKMLKGREKHKDKLLRIGFCYGCWE